MSRHRTIEKGMGRSATKRLERIRKASVKIPKEKRFKRSAICHQHEEEGALKKKIAALWSL